MAFSSRARAKEQSKITRRLQWQRQWQEQQLQRERESSWFSRAFGPTKRGIMNLISNFSMPDLPSDSDSDSEDGVKYKSDRYGVRFDGFELNEENVTSPRMIKDFSKKSQLTGRKSEIKYLIEELLMVQNFSRILKGLLGR